MKSNCMLRELFSEMSVQPPSGMTVAIVWLGTRPVDELYLKMRAIN